MAGIKINSLPLDSAYFGSVEISKIYYGNIELYHISSPPSGALQDSNSDYITDSNSDYISSAEIPAAALKDSNDTYITDDWGAEIIASTSVHGLKFYVDSQQLTPFTISMNGGKTWDGTIEYCDQYGKWSVWDGTSISAYYDGSQTVLYLRGTGNTLITGSGSLGEKNFVITSSQTIYATGNMEDLLDWQTVKSGSHPTMADYAFYAIFYNCAKLDTDNLICGGVLSARCYQYAFRSCSGLTVLPSLPAVSAAQYCYSGMFQGCTYLATAPVLPATVLATRCYENMFSGCQRLTTPPALPATSAAEYCYYQMFYNSGITTAPSLPATALAAHCYHYMFQNCKSLEGIPALPATTLAAHCYYGMFNGCTKIKVSETSGGEYINDYRIPSSGTGTTATSAMAAMFGSTGGTFKGAPTINTTYYTSNTVIPATT